MRRKHKDMQLQKRFLILSILSCCVLNAQDTLQVSVESQRLTEQQLEAGEKYVIDTVVDGQAFYKKEIKSLEQSDSIVEFQDLEHASQIDEKWLEELYGNSLFDTIYRTVSELDYKDGYRHGKYIVWGNGEIMREFNYENDQLNGNRVVFHANGRIQSEANFIDDKKEGVETWWHENGWKTSEIHYKDNERHGKLVSFNEKGEVIRENSE